MKDKRRVYDANVVDQSSLDIYLLMILSVSCNKMTSLILSHLYDYVNEILPCNNAFLLLSTNVGKEMLISRIVVAVPNTLVSTRLVDRSERESILLLACDLLVAFR
jgi:hypothetical protein